MTDSSWDVKSQKKKKKKRHEVSYIVSTGKSLWYKRNNTLRALQNPGLFGRVARKKPILKKYHLKSTSVTLLQCGEKGFVVR